jgi:type III pantothenate kinase
VSTVVVDVGNTRIKWARADLGRLRERGHALHAGHAEAALDAFFAALGRAPIERIVVANVGGQALADRLDAGAAGRFGVRPEHVETAAETLGVRCAYRDPSRLGVDRWVSVIAAHRAAAAQRDGPRPACVISAGTALTFDAVDTRGQHLGGLILPGPRIAADALARSTRRIGETPPAASKPAGLGLLGQSTEDAVGFAVLLAPAAGFDRAAAMVERELGKRPVVYLAGGDAGLLRPWLETEVEVEADLVLKGLALIAAETPPGGASLPAWPDVR